MDTARPIEGRRRWLRIKHEIFPMDKVGSVRCLSVEGTTEVWVWDVDGNELTGDETTKDDVGEHESLDDALRAAAAWDEVHAQGH